MDSTGGLNQGGGASDSNGGNDGTHSNNHTTVPSVLPGKHKRTMPKRGKGNKGGNSKSQQASNHSIAAASTASASNAIASTFNVSKETVIAQLRQRLCHRDLTISRLKANRDDASALARVEVSNTICA